jgi:methylated-DNA-protein-cysteine methyltransferase related protein
VPGYDARTERILARIRRIPRGRVATYGEIEPRAPRMVGRVLSLIHEDVPWHRVVRADGSLAKGKRQRDLLVKEGVPMRGDRVDLRHVAARGTRSRPRTSAAKRARPRR